MNEKNILPGYHLATIHKGELGEVSKILEEIEELIDAENQGCRVMAIVELADIIGAINAYIEKRTYGVTISDLETMASITKRAFVNGHRT